MTNLTCTAYYRDGTRRRHPFSPLASISAGLSVCDVVSFWPVTGFWSYLTCGTRQLCVHETRSVPPSLSLYPTLIPFYLPPSFSLSLFPLSPPSLAWSRPRVLFPPFLSHSTFLSALAHFANFGSLFFAFKTPTFRQNSFRSRGTSPLLYLNPEISFCFCRVYRIFRGRFLFLAISNEGKRALPGSPFQPRSSLRKVFTFFSNWAVPLFPARMK